MSAASIYEGQTTLIPVVNAFGNVFEEWQLAAGGQTVFILASFQYTPGTNTLLVFKNGLFQRSGVDYIETNSTRITFTAPTVLNDRIAFFAFATAGVAIPNGGGVPAGGTAGQVLTKASGNDYDSIWTSLSAIASLLDAPRQNIAAAATINLNPLSAATRNIQITGNTNITGFQIPNGQLWAVTFSGTPKLINGAPLTTNFSTDIQVAPGDTCFVRAVADNTVELIAYTHGNVPTDYNATLNNFINGNYQLFRRPLGAVADGGFLCDRVIGLTEAGAVTPSAINDLFNGYPSALRITQTLGASQRFGFAQQAEAKTSVANAAKVISLTTGVRSSTACTVRCALLAWTGAGDIATRDVVNNWASVNYTPGNFFVAANYTLVATGAVALTPNVWSEVNCNGLAPGNMVNQIMVFWVDTQQPTGTTIDFGKTRAGLGVARQWVEPDPALELIRSKRFLSIIRNPEIAAVGLAQAVGVGYFGLKYDVELNKIPTISAPAGQFAIYSPTAGSVAVTAIGAVQAGWQQSWISASVAGGLTIGQGVLLQVTNAVVGYLISDAEIGV